MRSPERRRGATLAKSSKPIKCNSRNDYHYKEEEEDMLKKQDDGDNDNQMNTQIQSDSSDYHTMVSTKRKRSSPKGIKGSTNNHLEAFNCWV